MIATVYKMDGFLKYYYNNSKVFETTPPSKELGARSRRAVVYINWWSSIMTNFIIANMMISVINQFFI